MRFTHPWPATFDARSRVLILGTFPSPRSRNMGYYYGHPQNLFWPVLAHVLNTIEPPRDIEARRAFVLAHHIALWDVLASCDIEGAADSSIRQPEANVFSPLLQQTNINHIFTTGRTATRLFNTLAADEAGMQALYLPSTSPANRATQTKPGFMQAWQQVAEALSE